MTIEDQLIQLNTIKQNIKTAINNKGGSVGNDFNTYANAITNLPSGVASGTIIYGKADIVTIEPFNATVKSIGDNDFYSWTHATGLDIKEGFTNISGYAFYNWSSARSISLPNSLLTIGAYSFAEWVNLNTDVVINGNLTTIGNNAFENWSNAKSLTLGASVINVGGTAFAGWSAATSLNFASGFNGLKGNYCFARWAALISVTLPNSVTGALPLGCFDACGSIQSFTLSENLTSLGSACMRGMVKLKTLTIPASIATIDASALNNFTACDEITMLRTTPPVTSTGILTGLKSTCVIKVPSSSLAAYQAATGWSAHASKMIGI